MKTILIMLTLLAAPLLPASAQHTGHTMPMSADNARPKKVTVTLDTIRKPQTTSQNTMDHSKMDHSKTDHGKTDHSTMNR